MTVTNNEAERRYELVVNDALAIAAYHIDENTVVLTHTEVPEALEGQGIGSRLVRDALDDVRRRGMKVRPLCSFVAGYMEGHPETRDLAE